MNDRIIRILAPVVLVLGFLLYSTLFTVNEIQQAIILQFGDPKRVILKAG